MIDFVHAADPHSLGVRRDGRFIGYLQWHKGRPPGFVLADAGGPYEVSIDEMEIIVERYHEEINREADAQLGDR